MVLVERPRSERRAHGQQGKNQKRAIAIGDERRK
jgi:hypothetical protein